MTGIQIQYLLGLYFIVISLGYSVGKVSVDLVKLIGGILFLILAIIGKSFI